MYEVSITGTTTDGVETVVGASTTGSFMISPAQRPEIEQPVPPRGNPNVPQAPQAPPAPPAESVVPQAPQNVTPPGLNQDQRPGRNTAPGQNR
jgi:hypothetical protein